MSYPELARASGLYDLLEPAYARWQMWDWRHRGRQTPAPSSVKRALLVGVARRHELDVLVETGTYRGDTVRALRGEFRTIYSIELADTLFRAAQRRCRRQLNGRLLHGDSALLLADVLDELTGPALFWLDAHYSGAGTAKADVVSPIVRELDLVLGARVRGNVVLIDDAREFHRPDASGYPPVALLRTAAAAHGYSFNEEHDIFHLLPADLT